MALGRTPIPTPAPHLSVAKKVPRLRHAGACRVLMWWPEHIPAGAKYDAMMSHIDCWATLAKMVGLTAPPHGAWTDNNGKPIYFDSLDNSEYILGHARHSARRSWVYINGEKFMGARIDILVIQTTPTSV